MISFVYFDLGGVAICDFSATNKWNELKRDLGINDKNEKKFEEIWERYENEICVNRDVDTLVPIFHKELHLDLAKNYSFLLEGFVNRFEKNPSIWPVLQEMKKNTRLGLLTNAYPRMFEAIRKRGIQPNIEWDVLVDSSIEHLQKPDRRIFELAEKKAGVKKEEILFVENSKGHVKAAQDFGWQTFLYDSSRSEKSSKDLMMFFNRTQI